MSENSTDRPKGHSHSTPTGRSIISNDTPARLTLESIDGEKMVFAPLEERAVEASSAFDFDELISEGIVSKRDEVSSDLGSHLSALIFGGGLWAVIIGLILASMEPWFGIEKTDWPWAVWGSLGTGISIAAVIMIICSTNSWSLVVRWTMQAFSLSIIVAIGVAIPAATIYHFGGGQEFFTSFAAGNPNQNGLATDAVPRGTSASNSGTQTEAQVSLAIYGRLIQLAFIAIASLLPVLLFFLFDRFQLSTLRKRLYVSLFRLDPTLKTIGEIHAKYGSQINEAYDTEAQSRGRLSPGSRWPVLVCALVFTLGWIITMSPVGHDYAPKDGSEVINSLLPQSSALVFGFLGVYFYSLRMISLRYARGDLKPKAYTHIMVRVFIVAALSWVVESIIPANKTALVLAFLFGFTPDEFFTWLKETFRGKIPLTTIPQNPLPLNRLEGIDIYDLGRLESEGIVNIEGLAHHDLIDLIIETRIPVPRLMDWMDQAILYLHLIGGDNANAQQTLRSYGIRTATDLLTAWDSASKRDDESLNALKKLLGGEAPLYRLEVIRDSLLDDEWMTVIISWREEKADPPIQRKAIPSSAEALEKQGVAAEQEQRYARAIRFYNKSIQSCDSAQVRIRLASIRCFAPIPELIDHDEAKSQADRAVELASNDHNARIELSQIYAALNDEDQAERLYVSAREIVESWPDSRKKQAELKRLSELSPDNNVAVAPVD